MKRIILSSLIFIATGSLFAQTPSTKVRDMSKYYTPVLKTKTAATTQKIKTTPAVIAKPAIVSSAHTAAKSTTPVATKTKVATTSTKTGVALKKDGTPDKRFKVTTAPVKKDGTPDMRYKQNKKS